MQQTVNYLTKEKRKSLEAELADLKGSKRREILEALRYAKSLGDLSENAEYHQAREDQGKLEERIVKVEQILKSSQIFSKGGGDIIGLGSVVVVQKDGDQKEKTYIIVGSEEADMKQGKISNQSPMGVAFLGKKKGGKVSFEAPNGLAHYKILSVA